MRKLQGLPQLEAAIMEALFWAVIPALNAVHPMEEHVQQLKTELEAMMTKSLEPVGEYLKLYSK